MKDVKNVSKKKKKNKPFYPKQDSYLDENNWQKRKINLNQWMKIAKGHNGPILTNRWKWQKDTMIPTNGAARVAGPMHTVFEHNTSLHEQMPMHDQS
jgi:hypothetical protein